MFDQKAHPTFHNQAKGSTQLQFQHRLGRSKIPNSYHFEYNGGTLKYEGEEKLISLSKRNSNVRTS